MRVMYRSVLMEYGDGSVIIAGIIMMLKSFVDNQDSLLQVRRYILANNYNDIILIIIDVVYRYYSYYGYGNGTIWLDYMYCDGFEAKLIDCDHAYDIGVTDCGYNEMAGVFCPCKYITYIIIIL